MLRIIALIGNTSLLILVIILAENVGGINDIFVKYGLVPWGIFMYGLPLIIACILNICFITAMKNSKTLALKTLALIVNICVLIFFIGPAVGEIFEHEPDSSVYFFAIPFIIVSSLNIWVILGTRQNKK